MNIGIFADWIGTQAGGIETYELGLIRALTQIDSQNSYQVYSCSERVFAKLFSESPNFSYKVVNPKSKILRFSIGLTRQLMKDQPDVLHVCSVPPFFTPSRYVMTVHDLASFVHPEYFPKATRMRLNMLIKKGIKGCEKIISISQATRQDILKFFDINPEKITVIHLGLDPCYKPVTERERINAVLEKYRIPANYILYTGRIQARKNITGLVKAYHILRSSMAVKLPLVLAGKGTWRYTEAAEEMERLGVKNDVIQLGHVAYSDLPYLYSGADVFVFASFYEGFGFPPLEAMACGTAVVTSNMTSIPEMVGEAAVLVDPYSPESIAEALRKVLSNEEFKKELIRKGLERVTKFSWEKTAEKTLSVYEQVCGIYDTTRGDKQCLTQRS
jgi:glycosyltransferase involved in cell wall biosynthesis